MGKLVSVGVGVSVGRGVNVLQADKVMTRIESIAVVAMVFMDFLSAALMF